MKRHMTLTELERDDWGPPPYESHVVSECHRLRHVPLRELSVENLRLLIGQGMSLEYLVPIALEHLSRDPLAGGDMAPGDLLQAVRRVPQDFWAKHPAARTIWERVEAEAPRGA